MKRNITLLIVGLIVLAGLALGYHYLADSRINSATFSNTMEWNSDLLLLAGAPVHYLPDWEQNITIAPPPANDSSETRKELGALLSCKSLRTADRLAQIKQEADNNTLVFAGRPLNDYLSSEELPATSRLFGDTFRDVTIITLALKKRFNRVRPHILEPKLAPAIEVPGHPAYPSGHATQAHFMAYLLGELVPDHREYFLEEAARIAKNREIAGLHYASDSEAGKQLAHQTVDLLLQKPKIQALLGPAREELQQLEFEF